MVKNNELGNIYVLWVNHLGKESSRVGKTYYKVGVTAGAVEERLYAMTTGCPYDINIKFAFYGIENPYTKERKIHDKFRSKKIHGEWFILNRHDLSRICNFLGDKPIH